MTGHLQDMKEKYSFETIDVPESKYMARLLADVQFIDGLIAVLAGKRVALLADIERIKEKNQVEALKRLHTSAQYGHRDSKKNLESYLRK